MNELFAAWYLFVALVSAVFLCWFVLNPPDLLKPYSRTVIVPIKSGHKPMDKRSIPNGGDGYVYILRDVDVTGWCKIGYTNNPRERIGHFDTKLPFDTDLLLLIPTPHYKTLERQLHKKYWRKRKRGEWFDLTDDDIAAIKRLRR